MNLYKTSLTPKSNFMTSLKGDTIFGQLCWSILHSLGKEKLETLLSTYDDKPFLIVSDAFAFGYFPKPKMPSRYLNEIQEEKKENRKKVWLRKEDLLNANYSKAISDKKAGNIESIHSETHNAIDYKSFTTGDAPFSPFSESVIEYSKKDIYFLLDETQLSLGELEKSFILMSEYGYGKKSSIGKGRFSFTKFEKVELIGKSNWFMTLSPSVLNGTQAKKYFYDTFVRFGKFGGSRAFKNPFKKPLLLADSSAVIMLEQEKELQYIGKSIRNLSDNYKDTVSQGYAIVIPLKGLK